MIKVKSLLQPLQVSDQSKGSMYNTLAFTWTEKHISIPSLGTSFDFTDLNITQPVENVRAVSMSGTLFFAIQAGRNIFILDFKRAHSKLIGSCVAYSSTCIEDQAIIVMATAKGDVTFLKIANSFDFASTSSKALNIRGQLSSDTKISIFKLSDTVLLTNIINGQTVHVIKYFVKSQIVQLVSSIKSPVDALNIASIAAFENQIMLITGHSKKQTITLSRIDLETNAISWVTTAQTSDESAQDEKVEFLCSSGNFIVAVWGKYLKLFSVIKNQIKTVERMYLDQRVLDLDIKSSILRLLSGSKLVYYSIDTDSRAQIEVSNVFPSVSEWYRFNQNTGSYTVKMKSSLQGELCIDRLLAGCSPHSYPPNNQHALAKILHSVQNFEGFEYEQKLAIFYYFLFDHSDNQNDFTDFCVKFRIPKMYQVLIEGYWAVDHGQLDRACKLLCDPVVCDLDWKDIISRAITGVNQLFFAEIWNEPPQNLQENDLSRAYKIMDFSSLLRNVKLHNLKRIIEFPLSDEEEKTILIFLKSKPVYLDVLVYYLARKNRFSELFELFKSGTLKSAIQLKTVAVIWFKILNESEKRILNLSSESEQLLQRSLNAQISYTMKAVEDESINEETVDLEPENMIQVEPEVEESIMNPVYDIEMSENSEEPSMLVVENSIEHAVQDINNSTVEAVDESMEVQITTIQDFDMRPETPKESLDMQIDQEEPPRVALEQLPITQEPPKIESSVSLDTPLESEPTIYSVQRSRKPAKKAVIYPSRIEKSKQELVSMSPFSPKSKKDLMEKILSSKQRAPLPTTLAESLISQEITELLPNISPQKQRTRTRTESETRKLRSVTPESLDLLTPRRSGRLRSNILETPVQETEPETSTSTIQAKKTPAAKSRKHAAITPKKPDPEIAIEKQPARSIRKEKKQLNIDNDKIVLEDAGMTPRRGRRAQSTGPVAPPELPAAQESVRRSSRLKKQSTL